MYQGRVGEKVNISGKSSNLPCFNQNSFVDPFFLFQIGK
jgi:hypothetical protein